MLEDTALDEGLAILSLQVAEQLDRTLQGKKANRRVLANFRKELSRASGLTEPNATAFLDADPVTAEIFAQAVRESSQEPLSDIASLGSAVMKIIEPIGDDAREIPSDEFDSLKAFCLALHRSIVAQGLPPLHEGDRNFEDELRFVR